MHSAFSINNFDLFKKLTDSTILKDKKYRTTMEFELSSACNMCSQHMYTGCSTAHCANKGFIEEEENKMKRANKIAGKSEESI